MGLDIYLHWKEQTDSDRASAALNELPGDEVTYLRSSYNDSGFDTWSRQQLRGRDLHWYLELDESRCQEMRFDDGAVEGGLVPDWNECRARVTEALEYARRIPDSLYAWSFATLMGDANELTSNERAIDEYRRVIAERSEELAQQQQDFNIPIEQLARGFKQGHAYFFEEAPPKIKSIMLCLLHKWPCITLVCEGPPEIHQGYIKLTEEILRFIDCGKRRNGWVTWSG